MRAAQVTELGRPPTVGEAPEPVAADGEVVLDVLAVPLNPLDIAVANGRFYGGHPPLPYIPGCEAVGRTADGGLVWAFGPGLGTTRNGCAAERVPVQSSTLGAVPGAAAPAPAAALGIAGLAGWMPVASRAPVQPGETVLVLGATGTSGLVALQAAKLLGAGRVVAAGRDEEGLRRAERVGADAVVRLDADDLVSAFREACGGDGPTLVVDPLWGPPAEAAVEAAAPGARIVQYGQSAGPTATLASAVVRGKQLSILGYSDFALPPDVKQAEYRRLVEHVTAGDIQLDDVASAWERQAAGAGTKLVLVLERDTLH